MSKLQLPRTGVATTRKGRSIARKFDSKGSAVSEISGDPISLVAAEIHLGLHQRATMAAGSLIHIQIVCQCSNIYKSIYYQYVIDLAEHKFGKHCCPFGRHGA
jgi:hypothetical protein